MSVGEFISTHLPLYTLHITIIIFLLPLITESLHTADILMRLILIAY